MPLDIQTGEVADRLREFFRLAGRIPSTLDESVIPVAVLQNLDQPPFRGPAAVDFTGWVIKAATAAELSAVGLGFPIGAGGKAVVNQIVIRNDGAAAALFGITLTSISYVLGFAGKVFVVNTEDLPPAQVGAGAPKRLGIYTATWHTGGAQVGEQIGHCSVPPGDTKILPIRVTLSEGWNLMVWQEVVNIGVRAVFHGTYYPEQ